MASIAQKNGPLGRRLAAHLLRRATFGPTRREIDQYANLTAPEAVNQLLTFPGLPKHPVDPKTGETWLLTGRQGDNSPDEDLKFVVNSWWLHQIFDPQQQLSAFSKVLFFLHTSFSTSFKIVETSAHHYYTLRLFMHYATGSYKDLARKICLDNGMNDYLDIGDSDKANPNQNFTREFFELFTIGKGPQIGDGDYTFFTEHDIREASRLMTGFRRNNDISDPEHLDVEHGLPRARPVINQHDITIKIFSEKFQNRMIAGGFTEEGMLQEVDEWVDMIFDQPQTAITICRRLYRMFVKRKISEEAEQDVILPLADVLRDNNYVILEALRVLLASQHFYDEDNDDSQDEVIGAIIKSPLELQAGMIRYLGVEIPDPVADPFETYVTFYRFGLQDWLTKACFDLFAPPDVAGYEPVFQAPEYHRLWISPKSLPSRYAMVDAVLDKNSDIGIDVMAFITDPEIIKPYEGQDPEGKAGPHTGAKIATHLVTELVSYLLPEMPLEHRYSYFLNEILLDTLSELNWSFEWERYEATGDDGAVKPQIVKLLRSILQSPEYQLG